MVDPAVPAQTNPMPPTTEPVKVKISKKKVYIIVGMLGICLLTALIYFFLPQSVKQQLGIAGTNPSTKSTDQTDTKKPEGAIAKVGKEYIFQKDLEAELANFPGATDEGTKKRLLNKLVKDSIVLQAGMKERLITPPTNQNITDNEAPLPQNIYNSPDKDYMKRIEEIKKVEKAVADNMDHISGTMVSVWFQNQIPAKIGIEKGKQEALKRITALHDKVAKKEITIEDAGRLISTNPSYADLDPGGYQNNAVIPFSYPKGRQITIDSGFDDILWKTKAGEVTPIYLGKTADFASGKEIEAYYIFGKVDKKVDTGNTTDFTKWYESIRNNYEVTIF